MGLLLIIPQIFSNHVVIIGERTSAGKITMKKVNSLAVLAISVAVAAPIAIYAQSTFGQPQIGSVTGTVKVLPNVKVIDFGKLIYTGKMDINPTITRIRKGTKLNHDDDGAIFTNVEKRLPVNSDKNYYREFVHQMTGFPFPGPQRVVIGKKGEVYYTGDHYASFYTVR